MPVYPAEDRLQTENGLQLYLNEIMASNSANIEDGDAGVWIELFYDGELKTPH